MEETKLVECMIPVGSIIIPPESNKIIDLNKEQIENLIIRLQNYLKND